MANFASAGPPRWRSSEPKETTQLIRKKRGESKESAPPKTSGQTENGNCRATSDSTRLRTTQLPGPSTLEPNHAGNRTLIPVQLLVRRGLKSPTDGTGRGASSCGAVS